MPTPLPGPTGKLWPELPGQLSVKEGHKNPEAKLELWPAGAA